MNLLAIDTSSPACSVAACRDDDVTGEHIEGAREHTRILVPMIHGVLDAAGLALQDLEAIVLGIGPGSFIGLRIGASVAQGLAHGSGLRIVPVSSLLAVAAAAFEEQDGDLVVVTQDAHMDQVYWGSYRRGDGGQPIGIDEERIVAADFQQDPPGTFIAAGGGWDRYPSLAAANSGAIMARASATCPDARWLLAAGARAMLRGEALDPSELSPAYLRNRVATPGG